MESVVAAVLREYYFAPPTIVDGPDAITWAIAARPHSDRAVEMARVKTLPDGRATVEIVSYQYGPSDWATLGRAFHQDRPKQEALEIQSAIQNMSARD